MSGADGVAFETLIYTDCVPGQGLQGTAGLQFQARSPGADRAAMALVQNADLYEPPPKWMRERRPVDAYPPSFAHAHDGIYATAAGVYLGREANGGREGNQLTHAVVTADPRSYGLHRPAQLFGAPFWSTRPAPGTECPPVPELWEPGPFDIGAAQSFVANSPRGTDLLERLLSGLQALGTPHGRRVLFISEDVTEVLRWIGAATLLLPQRQALGIGFKVFTTNPAYAAQPVVAVHPDWDSTAVTVDDDGGYAVFDLGRGEVTDVAVADDARRRVRLLVSEDPYDVLDVVEQAAANGLPDPEQALELAQSMVLRGRPLSRSGARIAVSWLRGTPPTLLPKDRDVLVDKLVGDIRQWPEEVLLGLDEVARTGQIDPDRVPDVRIALVGAELDRAARTGTAEGAALPPLPAGVWTVRHARDCEAQVLAELARRPEPTAFDAILRVAQRFDLRVHLDEVPESAEAFVRHWADHPEAAHSPVSWGTARAPLTRRLRAELTRRVEAGDDAEVGDAWRRWFTVPAPLSEEPLDAALLAAKMAHADAAARAALAREMLTAALAAPSGPDPVGRTAAALWRRRDPNGPEYTLLADVLPAGTPLPAELFAPLIRGVRAAQARPTRTEVDVLRRLYDHRLVPRSEHLDRLLLDDDRLAAMCRDLPHADPPRLRGYVDVLAGTSMPVRHLWGGELVQALLRVGRPDAVDQLVQRLPHPFQGPYVAALLESVGKGAEVVPAVVAFTLSEADFLPPDTRRECAERVRHWLRKAGEKRRQQATTLVESVLPRERRRDWAALVEDREQSRWPRWRRGKAEG